MSACVWEYVGYNVYVWETEICSCLWVYAYELYYLLNWYGNVFLKSINAEYSKCSCTLALSFSSLLLANKHKPWIETEYQGIVMENDNTVLLNPPLFALDKDAPLHYAGNAHKQWVSRQQDFTVFKPPFVSSKLHQNHEFGNP